MQKGVTLAIVMVSYRLDLLMGTSYIKDAVIIAFCVNELLSIIENAGLMGIPIPDSIKNAIEILNMRAKDESN
jgi:toxin secretion/phage lysis holin